MRNERVRREAEQRYHSSSHAADPSEPVDSAALIEELRIHQIELEIQNEELRDSRAAAERAQRRFHRLFEHAPVGYVTVRQDGRIESANFEMTRLVGRPRATVVAGSVYDLVDREHHQILARVLSSASSAPSAAVAGPVAADGPVLTGAEVRLASGEHRVCRLVATPDDDPEAGGLINVTFTDVTQIRDAERRAADAAEQNSLLLRELNHRVKNNLQLLLSLVTLQRHRAGGAAAGALAAVEERIRAVSLAHHGIDPRRTSGAGDLVTLLASVVRHYGAEDGGAQFVCGEPRLEVNADAAVSVGIAVNELVVNAIRHGGASGERPVVVRLEARRSGAGRLVSIAVRDSGPGLPDRILEDPSRGGLGFTLVGQLVEGQLDGVWTRRNLPDAGAEHLLELRM